MTKHKTLTEATAQQARARIAQWMEVGETNVDAMLYLCTTMERHALILQSLIEAKEQGLLDWASGTFGSISAATLIEIATEIQAFKLTNAFLELYIAVSVALEAVDRNKAQEHFINIEAEMDNLDKQIKMLDNLESEIETYLQKFNEKFNKKTKRQ